MSKKCIASSITFEFRLCIKNCDKKNSKSFTYKLVHNKFSSYYGEIILKIANFIGDFYT